MRVLGIDPGMQLTGYGCVELAGITGRPVLREAGVLRFNARQAMEDRLAQLYEELSELLSELQPEQVAVEKLYAHYRHPRTAIIMGHARGVILLAINQAHLPVAHLPATEVKKSLTGNGHASKRQVQQAVAARFGLDEPPSPPDVADAIAIALCHAQRAVISR
jgi:crossover junction endodeoxyribonuclease RuvC